jgi:ribosomal protein L21
MLGLGRLGLQSIRRHLTMHSFSMEKSLNSPALRKTEEILPSSERKRELLDKRYMTMNYYWPTLRRKRIFDNFKASQRREKIEEDGEATRSDYVMRHSEAIALAEAHDAAHALAQIRNKELKPVAAAATKKTTSQMSLEEALGVLRCDGPHYFAKAIIKGRFFTFACGDQLVMNRLHGVSIGAILRLTQVTEIGSPNLTWQGSPFLEAASAGAIVVRARVLSHTLGKEVLAARGKQRKGHRKHRTATPPITILEIIQIAIR